MVSYKKEIVQRFNERSMESRTIRNCKCASGCLKLNDMESEGINE